MEDPVIAHELSQLDYTKVAALQQKRTLAFVNHFVSSTVDFLNTFVQNCEVKLETFERKLQKVEASLIILEAKLSSVPELSHITIKTEAAPRTAAEVTEPASVANSNTQPHSSETTAVCESLASESEASVSKENEEKIKPEYQRFVKMVHVGVPLEAVKLKITLEGLDASYFENHMHR